MKSLVALLVVSLTAAMPAAAGWAPDGTNLCTLNSARPNLVSDGAGGAIIVWMDYRSGTNNDIYAQRVDASGTPLWTANGVALCTAANNQLYPELVSDGAGGAVVTWIDYRSGTNYDIYAQRINASGVPLWAANGVALCTAANDQLLTQIASDGAGGGIVAWRDARSPASTDIYARRVDASGTVLWTANGVSVCSAVGDQSSPVLVPDGAGGAVVAWQDLRNALDENIYAQRLNSAGTPQWTANGVAICLAAEGQLYPQLATDGAGGAIITWEDFRNTNYDVFAQHVSGAGSVQWVANGIAVCTALNTQSTLVIVPNGPGGSVIAWRDYRNGLDYDIYAQRLDAFGNAVWDFSGIPVCNAAGSQHYPNLVSDGAGDFIISWEDYRNGSSDIYAQSISAAGAALWTVNGVALSLAASTQGNSVMIWDGAGGAVVAWDDFRSGATQVYAQRAEGIYGTWGHPEPIVSTVADIPNDQGGKVAVNWMASGRDLPNPRAISHYSIWRAVDALPMSAEGIPAPTVIDFSRVRAGATGPVYVPSTVPGYFWELVGTQDAHGWPGYSFSAATRADSVSGDPGTEVFMVAAHDQADDYVAYASKAVSGHSVDNLAPSAPLMLTAQRVGNDVRLGWNHVPAPDLRDYTVYRAASPGIMPVQLYFLASTTDTGWVDTGAPTSVLHYIVTASDVHQNQSVPSNEASVGTTTGIGGELPLTALRVLANRPNPFAASTAFRIGLPTAAQVTIEVFDVAGQRVRTLSLAGAEGWQEVPFDGRNDEGRPLSSGAYFYRVAAGGVTQTGKMVLAR